jgi:hypothetical protein
MICAYDKCNNGFEPKTHNQKYCSDECCRTATNEKLKQAYYDKKARLQGKKRLCKGCNAPLSRYTEGNMCSKCLSKKEVKARQELVEMVKNVFGKTSQA